MYNPATWSPDGKLGGVTLKTAAAVTADTTETAVFVGKGKFRVVLTWTTCEVATGNEFYNVLLEANTRGATSTYKRIAPLGCFGHSSVTGDGSSTASTGEIEVLVDNPYDYQVRIVTYVNGTIDTTGLTFGAVAYPLLDK